MEPAKPEQPSTLPAVAPTIESLFVSPEEALEKAKEVGLIPVPPPEVDPEEPEDDDSDAGPLLAEEVTKITKALDRLAKKGLNMKAVITLLHAATPTISKKTIRMVLDGLQQLPAIYGKDARSADPLKR